MPRPGMRAGPFHPKQRLCFGRLHRATETLLFLFSHELGCDQSAHQDQAQHCQQGPTEAFHAPIMRGLPPSRKLITVLGESVKTIVQ